jgi:hypothetical protein
MEEPTTTTTTDDDDDEEDSASPARRGSAERRAFAKTRVLLATFEKVERSSLVLVFYLTNRANCNIHTHTLTHNFLLFHCRQMMVGRERERERESSLRLKVCSALSL